MSMNLYFRTKKGGHYIDFPFQTRTDCTYAVLAAKTVEERMGILRQEYPNIPEYMMRDCETLLRDNNLRLTYL